MKTEKSTIRGIMLDIVFQHEKVENAPDQINSLFRGIAEVLARRNDIKTFAPRLSKEDDITATEVFYDLIQERTIVPAKDSHNLLPHFRLHSEAAYPDVR